MERKAHTAFGETGFGEKGFGETGRHRFNIYLKGEAQCFEVRLHTFYTMVGGALGGGRHFQDAGGLKLLIYLLLKCLFARANVLVRRFADCSIQVKLKLFNTYCLCFYDIALWENFHVSVIGKLASAYIKCLKLFFFGFSKYSSVTAMLLQLGVPSFNTVLHNI